MTVSKEWKSIWLGVAAAGFGPLVGGSFFYLVRGELNKDIAAVGLVMSLVAYPYALIFACIFGLPLFILARRFHLVRWWSAVGCGLVVGSVVQFVVLPGKFYLDNYLLYVSEGIASALLFFAVWRWREHA
jgi:uncharacterized membrane protein YagU involved in acid resistance